MNPTNPEQPQGHGAARTPIAIIGIGCRFPGGIASPEAFWQFIQAGNDAIREIPADRFDLDIFYDPRPATPGRVMTRYGGFLEHIDQFDAAFFGIAPREADRLDPQQRLLLETAWEALEDAGQSPEHLAAAPTGVFIGMWLNDYEARMFADPEQADFYMTTGSGRYAASGRLSYAFGFQGPSMTIDTACSSSLAAVHLACQSIWSGESAVALAGGANTILQPHISIAYSQSKMMAPDGHCKFGDASANGYVRSEGAAIVVLKPLDQAQADGDPVYAVIAGSAVTNDGQSSGFLATPGQGGQEEMLRRAYANARIDPRDVQYVEAHGTGTLAGDPVELGAIGTVLGAGRPADQPCIVGSVKTNIGHTEGAAGVAGLIKVALALKHREIPATLHLRQPNPAIDWHGLRVAVRAERLPWPDTGKPATAGVSSFGIAGTNAHVVLQAAPVEPTRIPAEADDQAHLLALSAKSPEALVALASRVRDMAGDPALSLADLCYNAGVRRAHHDQRLALAARGRAALCDQLDAFVAGEQRPGLSFGPASGSAPNVVFVFPGQGSQWHGMAQQLLAESPIVRDAIERCDRAIQAEAGWSLLDTLAGTHAQLDEIDVIQPALFAVQIALAALWQSWGITPTAVVGHSMGEVAAAHVAGILTLEDAVRVICRRSRLLRRISGQGAMAAVELTIEQAQAAIAGFEDQLSIAVSNSPTSTVLSGDPTTLEHVLEQLQRRDVFCRRVKVDVASHSPQVDPLRDDLLAALADLRPQPATTPFFSTVTARFEPGEGCDASYWERNLRQPVLFAHAVGQLLAAGQSIFVEVSPHPILLPAVESTLHHLGASGHSVPSLRREADESATMLASLGQLYTLGCMPNWLALYPKGNAIRLPTYPWQRERFWYDAPPTQVQHARSGHSLLGTPIAVANNPATRAWQTTLDLAAFPFLADHRVRGTAIFPATGYVELALAAGAEHFSVPVELGDMVLNDALVFGDGAPTVQIVLERQGSETCTFRVFSQHSSETGAPSWQQHASGTLRRAALTDRPAAVAIEQLITESTPSTAADHDQAMRERGLEYGSSFQAIAERWRSPHALLAKLVVPAITGAARTNAEQIVLLDGALQAAVAALPAETAGATYVPVRLGAVRVYQQPKAGSELWSYALQSARSTSGDELFYDILVCDATGQVLIECRGLVLRQLAGGTAVMNPEWLYTVRWQAAPLADHAHTAHGQWIVFADGDLGQAVAQTIRTRGGDVVLVAPGTEAHQAAGGSFTIDPSRAEDYNWLLALSGQQPLRGVVHAWTANLPAGDPLALQTRSSTSVLLLAQALLASERTPAPRLWLVSSQVQAVNEAEQTNPAGAPLWGLGRVLANEHAELRPTLVDIAPNAVEALVAELCAGAADDQVVLRGDARLVARLVHAEPARHNTPTFAPAGTPYRLGNNASGLIDKLALHAAARRAPAAGEIEIAIDAAGLNFLDVLKSLGMYTTSEAPSVELAIGGECSGTVVAVGSGVTAFAVGEQVVALTPSFERVSCLASHVTIPSELATPHPVGMAIEAAAGTPIAFLTAFYALHTIGRMQAGDWVLIHAAAGGVGLAALQLAQRAGAQVFATAGSQEKRNYLHSLGVEHVFDSRTLDFVEQIQAATNGRGVDLVLNSLAGEALVRSVTCLAPGGRFLEIGKRDIYDNNAIGLELFKLNRSFVAIDLASMIEYDRAAVAMLFQTVMALLASGELQPLPTAVYPIGAAADAFRTMAQAGHTGKIVVTMRDQQPQVLAKQQELRADATYLITGGLGALGLAVAEHLAKRGVHSLALMGRNRPSTAASAAIARIEQLGPTVSVLLGDVAQSADLAHVLATIDRELPPLRGVIHAAGVLADATVAQMDVERFHTALAPKIAGAWNLHQQTLDHELDHFVLFSSAAALVGSPGQSNYAAGNAFLDGLAQARRASGLSGLSIAWGPWLGIGLAAAHADRGNRLANRGLGGIPPQAGLAALDQLLDTTDSYLAVMPFDANQWREAYPAAARSTLLAGFEMVAAPVAQHEPHFRDALLAAERGKRRRSLLENHLREQIARVLRLPPARIDSAKPLKTMGLDSLMAIEFKNHLEQSLGLSLSATLAWNYPTITVLAGYLAERMDIPLDAPVAETIEQPEIDSPTDALAELSQDELAAMLDDELAAIDALLKE